MTDPLDPAMARIEVIDGLQQLATTALTQGHGRRAEIPSAAALAALVRVSWTAKVEEG